MWQKIKNVYHLSQALLAAIYFNFPSKKLTVVGVTGTDGKTTTVHMISHILESAGKKVSMVSSIGAQIGTKTLNTGYHVSTPSPFQVQKLLDDAVKAKSNYFVLEATSHGLDQNRLGFVDIKVAVLTNITTEHMDYHKNWQNYALAKAKLFQTAQTSVLNIDDSKSYSYLSKLITNKLINYSISTKGQINPKSFPVLLNLPGDYNLSNALAAAAACQTLGVEKFKIQKALKTFKAPAGRMQEIDMGQNFKAVVDFAHTPNALKNALRTLKTKSSCKLIAVFGAASGRDKSKRKPMGEVADDFSDVIVLTSEDPRNEKPLEICEQIASGVKKKILNKNLFIIPDRKEAIGFAISKAQKGDTVGFFGKGHEQSMNILGREYPWDEAAEVELAIKTLSKNA